MAIEIYAHGQRHHLLLSAHPQLTRIHLSAAKPSRGVDRETPLLLLLRKYIVGGRIVAIEQPELERVLLLSIAKGPQARNTPAEDGTEPDQHPFDDLDQQDALLDDEQTLRCELIIEAMERRGNIILVGNDNIILESARHVTPRISRRPVQTHEPYELPPRQDKRDPRHASAEGVRALLESAETDLARALVGAYRGLSPLAAREAVYRATGQAAAQLAPELPWAAVAEAVRALWTAPWLPCLAAEAGPLAFAPYLLTHLAPVQPQPSISAALETFYATREQLTSHQQRRDTVRHQLEEARERLDRQRRLLAEEMARANDMDRLRWEGEMIYGFLHLIAPGQASLVVEGRAIALDPQRTPVENAQERFHAYDKAKSALTGVPDLLRAVETRLAGLQETLTLLELAEGFEQIEAIAAEAVEQGYVREQPAGRKKQKIRRQPPLRVESSDGYTIYVGRSAGQNEHVTFKIGAHDDLWLHARGIPGGHVIIKSGGREVPEPTLREAAGLAAYFSQHRSESAVDVEIARRSQVRRIPDAPAGLVNYRADRTIRVAPRPPDRRPTTDDRRSMAIIGRCNDPTGG